MGGEKYDTETARQTCVLPIMSVEPAAGYPGSRRSQRRAAHRHGREKKHSERNYVFSKVYSLTVGSRGTETGTSVPIRESPDLSGAGVLSLTSLLKPEGASSAAKETKSGGSTLIAEGIPPISTRLVEKIRAWQFVDLAELLPDQPGAKAEDSFPHSAEGQIVLVQSLDQVKKKKKHILDAGTWSQAFATYVATLASADETSKEEIVGLMAHQHIIIQMQKDLGGSRWLAYDHQYREWAAATKLKKWGEIHLSIYGRCLSAHAQLGGNTEAQHGQSPVFQNKKAPAQKRSKSGKNMACFKHNFEGGCPRSSSECHFEHNCWHCSHADHIAYDCPRGPKRPARAAELIKK